MNTYLLVKTLHIISATLLVGTGFGTAFYMFWVNRSGSVAAQSVVARWVVCADWWFTTPTVIFQVASGTWMIWQAGWPWSAKWIWMTPASAGCRWCDCNCKWRKLPLTPTPPARKPCQRVTGNWRGAGNCSAIPLSAPRWLFIS